MHEEGLRRSREGMKGLRRSSEQTGSRQERKPSVPLDGQPEDRTAGTAGMREWLSARTGLTEELDMWPQGQCTEHPQAPAGETSSPALLSYQIEKAMQAPGGQLGLNQALSAGAEDTETPEVGVTQASPPLPFPYGAGKSRFWPGSPPCFLTLQALARVCTLMRKLHTAYSSLASGLQGLPEYQRQVGQARHSLCDLYGIVNLAGSSEELPAERLAQSRQGVGLAWRGLDQLLDGLQHSPPPGWLVGPFTLAPGTQQV